MILQAFRHPVLDPDTASVKGFCIISVLVAVLVPVSETASVNTPQDMFTPTVGGSVKVNVNTSVDTCNESGSHFRVSMQASLCE